MSTKRLRERRPDGPPAASPMNKKAKLSHVPAKKKTGLEDLVDDNAREGKKLEAKLTNGVPQTKASTVDESHAVVAPDTSDDDDSSSDSDGESQVKNSHKQKAAAAQPSKAPRQTKPTAKASATVTKEADKEIINIGSSEEESSDLPESEAEDANTAPVAKLEKPLADGSATRPQDENGQANAGAEDTEMQDADEEADQANEPTFGDLLQARHPEPIDLQMSLGDDDPDSRGPVPSSGNPVIPAGHTLGTLLSQALRNNDKDLLETCFAMNDQQSIRATIQRQRSQEIVILLERIADRIHKRPGRAGNLMVWIQWSLVSHGGYLANQPELMKKLKAVYQVVRERASGLQPLLHLKGKLDLLSAQLESRRSLQAEAQQMSMEVLDDPNGVLYIEGEEEDSADSDEEADMAPQSARSQKRQGKADSGLPNGVSHDEEEDTSDDEEDDEANDLLDVEAEEGSDDEDEERSEDEDESMPSADEDDASESGESDEEESNPPPKPSTLNRKR